MRFFFLTLILLITSVAPKAQDLAYKFQIEGVSDTVIYLANYYGEKLYYADTAYADEAGRFGFKAIEEDEEGKYAVVLPGPRYFEIILADNEKVNIVSDTTDLTGNLEVIESQNNKIMYDYVDYLTERRKEREKFVEELEKNEGDAAVTARIKMQYNELNDRVIAYQKKIAADNPDKFAAKEILMSVDPEVPEELREDKTKAYYWFRDHYFDNIDLKDDRIIRTPVFHSKFTNYLNTTLLQDPDTLIPAIDALVAKLEPGSEVFKYVVHYTTYNFETSKIMGLDKVFVHMVDTYYKDGIAYWMDDDKLKSIQEKADTKRNTLIGLKAPNLTLADSSGNWISIEKDIKKKYVVLFFYDPDCGHCKKETPKLVEFYNNYEGDDLAVYAVSSENGDKWTKFVQKNEMDFYNTTIPQKAFESAEYATNLITSGKTNYQSLKYQETFDIFSTPKIFILDEKRIIRAKDIGVEQIGSILERLKNPPQSKDTAKAQ